MASECNGKVEREQAGDTLWSRVAGRAHTMSEW